MLPPLADLAAFKLRLPPGSVAEADEPRAEAALSDTSALVRVIAQTDWMTVPDDEEEEPALDTAAIPDLIVATVIAIARRAFDNPDGVRQEQLGSYSVSYANSSAGVYVTKTERRNIRTAAGLSGLGTIELEGAFEVPIEGYVPVETNGSADGDLMPWLTPLDL